MTPFRDLYVLTSKNYVSTEPKTRLFRTLNNKIFKSHSSAFIFQEMYYFQSYLAKPFPSHICSGSFREMYAPTSKKYISTDSKNR